MDEPRISIEQNRHPGPLPAPDRLAFGTSYTDHMFLADYTVPHGWQSPRVVPLGPLSLSPAAAALHYGQTLFDGCKAIRGVDGKVRIFRLSDHCQRLADGAAGLCMPPVPVTRARQALLALVGVDNRWVPHAPGTYLYLRPTLVATEPFLGVRPANAYTFFIIASPSERYFGKAAAPLRILVEDTYTRAAAGGLGAIKAGANYAASLAAAAHAKKQGYSQVLWTDARDHQALTEIGAMNAFVQLGDEIATPPLDGTILPGVTRASVLTLLARWGYTVNERRITMDEIMVAHGGGKKVGIFGTGTGAGIAPVSELGWKGHVIALCSDSPVTTRLQSALDDIQSGAAADADGWMTIVP